MSQEIKRVAFKMKIFPGTIQEYKKRHDELWPELKQLLKETGIHDYSIFLEEESLCLFGILKIANQESLDNLAEQPVMKKWWHHMKDLMETNADESPVSVSLKEVFYLP
jgi:L-rhamnose mutarotase